MKDEMDKERPPNKLQREMGVVHTAAVMGQICLFDVKCKDQDGIIKELRAQGCQDLSSFPNFTSLQNKLRELSQIENEDTDKDVKETKHFTIKSNYDWTKLKETE